MNDTPMRSWCAVIQYPGLQPALFGTVIVRAGAPDHEVEAALRKELAQVLPDGWSLRNMIPGSLIFVPEPAPLTQEVEV